MRVPVTRQTSFSFKVSGTGRGSTTRPFATVVPSSRYAADRESLVPTVTSSNQLKLREHEHRPQQVGQPLGCRGRAEDLAGGGQLPGRGPAAQRPQVDLL